GATGATGATGPAGATRESGTAATIAAQSANGTIATATVTCSSGVVLGGGAHVVNSGTMIGVPLSSYPSSTTQWTAQAVIVSGGALTTGTTTVTPWVLCSQ
ncbi:MAG: hypothetical protein ACRDF9_15335, partial [Candidatus Limnocylindria bacterium]